MTTPHDDAQSTPDAAESLRPTEARRAEEEARDRTVSEGEAGGEARRRGRIEAEAHRVSEEMTHRAQERRHAMASSAPHASPATAPSTPGETAPSGTTGREQAQRRALPAQLHIAGIVAPLDGAPYAERSIPYAVAAARTTGSGLLLVHVGDHADSQRAEKGAPDAAAYLRALRGRVSDMAPDEIRVDTLAVEGPSVAAAVLQIVEREHAGLIVLATHARQGIERRLLGSVGDQLVEQGHTPILFIPPRAEVPATPPSISRALVPLDGSAVAEQAIGPVLGLAASASGAVEMEIVLFQVVENSTLRDDAARYLAAIRDALVARGLPTGVRVTPVAVVGSAPGAIVAAAERGIIDEAVAPGTFDMVAMGTHGRGGLQRWLYGSVTSYVLPRIAVPALLVRPVRTDM